MGQAMIMRAGGVSSSLRAAIRIVHNYEYGGRNLKEVFATAADLHGAVAAGDFSKIRVGDYWPVTLNGSYMDYGEEVTKTFSNAVMKFEVCPNVYLGYGATLPPNHLLMVPRDCLPGPLKMRKTAVAWADTGVTNPWLGSALYKTFNNPTNGVIKLLEQTDVGPYIYGGATGQGMSLLAEIKASGAANSTGWAWVSRGKLFVPIEPEVLGMIQHCEKVNGGAAPVQWPLFIGSYRHIVKRNGDNGSPVSWWGASSLGGNSANFTYVGGNGIPSHLDSSTAIGAVPCFLFV